MGKDRLKKFLINKMSMSHIYQPVIIKELLLNNNKNSIKSLAKKFLRFILTEDFQSIIPSSNIMYPVTKIKNLPEAFKELEIPKAIQLDPATINANKKEWIEEWLNAW